MRKQRPCREARREVREDRGDIFPVGRQVFVTALQLYPAKLATAHLAFAAYATNKNH